MRKILSILLLLSALGSQTTYGQNIIINPKSNAITVKKTSGSDFVIPIEVDFINLSTNASSLIVTLQMDNTSAPIIFQFDATNIANTLIKISNPIQTIDLNANETKKAVFYFIVDKAIAINYDKIVFLKLSEGANLLCTIKVTIQPEDKLLSLDEYMEDDKNAVDRIYRLNYVTKVESSNNIMTIHGYKEIDISNGGKQDAYLKRSVELKEGDVFTVKEWGWVFSPFYWKPLPISLITVPFKIRPDITSIGKHFSGTASSGINNFGFNLELGKRQWDRYFATGKKSSHKFSLGVWAAPSVEELDSIYTFGANGAIGKTAGKMEKSKQLFMSTGLTFSYSYNDISFVFVPVGWDFRTSTIGKSWIYNKQRWWGFGVAISPKIFETVLNK